MTLHADTVSRVLIDRTAAGIPEGWRVAIINAYSVKPRRSRVSVNCYELRAYDPTKPSGQYRRKRRNGYQPLTLASRLSGSGVPQWMARACALLNGEDPDAPPIRAILADRSGAFPLPPDTPFEEWARGVHALLAEVAAASRPEAYAWAAGKTP